MRFTERINMADELQEQLDSFDPAKRAQALDILLKKVADGQIELADAADRVNLHCHTAFSYNCYGYSPTSFAWLACKKGLSVAGIVDFDVLDGVVEFLDASRKLDLRACAGIETRVFVPEFADKVMNSPGEPGISYHMGVGFPNASVEGDAAQFLANLKATAQQRNRALIDRVNRHLEPAKLDYETDVLCLTPADNATERHICLAYARKARQVFDTDDALAEFWTEKLGTDAKQLGLPEGRDLINTIRAKTMKRGGVGYVQPGSGSFPTMEEMNRFVLDAGGIPTATWLDGTSAGEQQIQELLEIAMSTGVAALNIIPDRNYTTGIADEKVANLFEVVELAENIGLPVVVGTEMNSPGQKFVDDFDSPELARIAPVFMKGAYIVYAHSILQRCCSIGYVSEWAKQNFKTVAEKNDFYEAVGRAVTPQRENILAAGDANSTPDQIRKIIQ